MEVISTDIMFAHEIIVRVLLSFLCGLIIGLERSVTHKKIGFRTLTLVCVGSTAFTLVSIYGFKDVDTSRIAAQIVTGIGFLGAGAIIHTSYATKGLTTAAALWVSAAVGMACGTGMVVLATTLTVMSIILLWVMKPIKKHLDNIVDNGNDMKNLCEKSKVKELGEAPGII